MGSDHQGRRHQRKQLSPSMAPKVGYLLPTRESVMQGRTAAGPLLKLAERRAWDAVDGAMYLPVCFDCDIARAEARIGEFLEAYYPGRGEMMKKNQGGFAGRAAPVGGGLSGY